LVKEKDVRPEQKRAWFVLGVFAVALTGFLLLTPLLGAGAWGAFGVLGFWGLPPLLWLYRRRHSEEVSMDERDQLIAQKATLAGGMASYLVFVLAGMITWFVRMFRGDQMFRDRTISIHVLPLIVLCGAIALVVVRAVTTLVLYGRGASDAGD
jgi:uncharacterized Tic20 family protein